MLWTPACRASLLIITGQKNLWISSDLNWTLRYKMSKCFLLLKLVFPERRLMENPDKLQKVATLRGFNSRLNQIFSYKSSSINRCKLVFQKTFCPANMAFPKNSKFEIVQKYAKGCSQSCIMGSISLFDWFFVVLSNNY